MLAELDVDGVLLGHSERRQYFNETDAALQAKVVAALDAGLAPMLCVGETEDEREAGDTERKLRHQVLEGLEKVPAERLPEVTIAYEPIWAIGTGKVATPEIAQEACALRARAGRALRQGRAEQVRVLYGGSVKPDNAAELMAQPDIDGFLVGGASLEPESFAAIVEAAELMAPDARSCLVILDGWGLAEPGRATPSRWPTRRSSTSSGDATTHDADRLRRGRRAARGPDGQLRGRPPQPRRRRGRQAGPDAHRRGRLRSDNEALLQAHRGRRARAPDRAGLRRRRALLRPAPVAR